VTAVVVVHQLRFGALTTVVEVAIGVPLLRHTQRVVAHQVIGAHIDTGDPSGAAFELRSKLQPPLRMAAARCGHAQRWLELRAKLESCAGRITRVDVCADDLVGDYPLRMAQKWYANGDFDNRGQRPKAQLVDDYDSGD
ncbi:hypothetical protein, partial [Pseudomonas syringae group genomosp. 7]